MSSADVSPHSLSKNEPTVTPALSQATNRVDPAAAELKPRLFNLPDTIVAILIPLVGYLLVYTSQYGYFAYFNLPTQFIAIDVGTAFNALSGIYATVIPVVLFLLATVSWYYAREADLQRVGLFLWAMATLNVGFIRVLTLFGIIVVDSVLFAIMILRLRHIRRKHPGAALPLIHISDAFGSPWNFISAFFGNRALIIFYLVTLAGAILFSGGWDKAAMQTTYFVTKSSPHRFVAATQGDYYVLIPYKEHFAPDCDFSQSCYYRTTDYEIHKMSDREPLQLVRKTLGPMQVRKHFDGRESWLSRTIKTNVFRYN